jgi:SAM-dependent methyltransferase
VKTILLKIAAMMGLIWQLVPVRLRHLLIKGLMVLETRGNPAKGLARAFSLEDDMLHVINERALALGGGIHPKHRLTKYHNFFTERVEDGDHVLDVGCSYGAVARSVARSNPAITVMGVDLHAKNLGRAKNHPENPPNLQFFLGDATQDLPEGVWNVIILSNVLEHISDRIGFLQALCQKTRCQKILIRVPCFERDWSLPMRRELGVNYYSDNDHKIEHTGDEFAQEMDKAGLKIDEIFFCWGEIWATVHPQ